MQIIQNKSITKSRKCGICGERLYHEDAIAIVETETGKVIAAYCCGHSITDIMWMHPDAVTERDAELIEEFGYDVEDSMRQFERRVEDFAAYRAAGCASQYWEDRDAGFAH